jgi:hypothetical protein
MREEPPLLEPHLKGFLLLNTTTLETKPPWWIQKIFNLEQFMYHNPFEV